jgi:DNA polymerase elongation subunit (family B)
MENIISQEVIETFLNGEDPEMYIVGVEYDYRQNKIYKVIQDPERGKIIKEDKLTPFLWVADLDGLNFYDNLKIKQQKKMAEHGITIEKLRTDYNMKLENGMKYLVKCSKGYLHMLDFFRQGGIDPWGEKHKKYFTILNVVEQFLIQSKKRLFKGIDEYEDVHRFVFDIETTGLDPENDRLILIGVKDNKGYRELIPALGEHGERACIIRFFNTIREILPTIIGGHNSAEFDFPFIERRAEILGLNIRELSSFYTEQGLRKNEGLLKLGGEVEPYNQYRLFGFNIVDIAHGVRRAQAINSNIKSWGLKYITDFIGKKKPNRVYVDGAYISQIYLDKKDYYLNPRTGKYKLTDDPSVEGLMEKYPGKFEVWNGQDIVKQYLDDDLYETMVVDDSFSQSTFLLSKLVPTTYERLATMGTATLWKLIMLAWSYEHGLAIPERGEKRKFTGGLSRLLNVGYAENVVKFDYSSLYPSIQLVYDIFPEADIMHVQKSLLKYFRDVRIKYKNLGIKYEKTDPNLSDSFNRKQLPIKIFINGYFGSLSAPHIFPWGDVDKGEFVTCMGRQSLRMMIMWFGKRGYKPLVMDSVEYDTPVFLKDLNDDLEILPICDLFDESKSTKNNDEYRDFSPKDYLVLTKSGWKNINYIYKHGTNKNIHKVVTKDRLVCCTSDHSLFQNGKQIKPENLNRGDKIDIIDIPTFNNKNEISKDFAKLIGFFIGDGSSYYKKVKRTYNGKHVGLTYYECNKGDFTLNNTSLEILNEMKDIIKSEYNYDVKIKDYLNNSGVYKLRTAKVELAKWFSKYCYTANREKKIPQIILNSNDEILKSFMEGFYLADGWGNNFDEATDITQKSKTCLAGVAYILKRLNVDYKISIRKDKENVTSLILGLCKNGNYYKINSKKSKRKSDEVWFNNIQSNKDRFVYDISTEDGTFVGGIGGVLLKNTDGVNFAEPKDVSNVTYVGKGLNDLVEKGKEYKGVVAHVAEFNDIFMRNEMGLDIDGIYPATINVSRKNYIIKKVKKGKTKVEITGNTIKSKKLPTYVEKFFNKTFPMLLDGDGEGFLEEYYEYVNKIFNQQIPLADIANKSRVKMTNAEYKKHIKKKTKAGNSMSRQAHMELILANNYRATLGETIFYVNNGERKSHGDVKKLTKPSLTFESTQEKRDWIAANGKIPMVDDGIKLNCYMIDSYDIENNPEKTGEYNVARYLDNFNKRVKPLLVVFHPDIRDEILITDPQKRPYFTPTQMKLDSGHPYEEKHQDKMDEVMTLSDTEIIFWNKMGIDPYYLYLEDSIKEVDENWVIKNRELVKEKMSQVKNNEEEIIDNDGHDYALHTDLYTEDD